VEAVPSFIISKKKKSHTATHSNTMQHTLQLSEKLCISLNGNTAVIHDIHEPHIPDCIKQQRNATNYKNLQHPATR